MRERGRESSMAIAAAFAPASFAALPQEQQMTMVNAAFPDVNVSANDVMGKLGQWPLRYPIASAVVLGALTIGAGAPPDAAQSTGFISGIESVANSVADFTTENWYWLIPSAAAFAAVVDTVRDSININENMARLHHAEGKQGSPPTLNFTQFFGIAGSHFFGEAGEMLTVTLAAGAIREGKVNSDMATIGKLVVPLFYLYAFLPDTFAGFVSKWLIRKPLNWGINIFATAINSWNEQASARR